MKFDFDSYLSMSCVYVLYTYFLLPALHNSLTWIRLLPYLIGFTIYELSYVL